ncbi:hypothetical protein DH2020_045617 [Rehmannia glutinosa]|uniref:Reverse transcriptase domain-containing protein n=1 Tax=Rehmannia glutinosa TaxID=99300 RepID=A0ABR0UEB1_REHGL
MHPFKLLGLDGMSPDFFQKFWHLIRSDVINFVFHVLNNQSFEHNINFTHIVLIPKTKNPDHITQFRPISLCNVIYKLASKVLANRIRTSLPKVISESQSAFILGYLITDIVLLAHEFHHHMKTKPPSSTGLMSIKLDISKAFDRVEWVFIRHTMSALGFPPPFVDLIIKCVSTTSFSFLLNGMEFGHLTPSISSYLFIICSEVFSCLLQDLQHCRKIHGIAISQTTNPISHLFFADDTLLFGKITVEEAKYLCFAIRLYEKVSGQLVNLDKSGIIFNKDINTVTATTIVNILGFKKADSHGKYLGLPSVIGINKNEILGNIKDRIWQRIHCWNSNQFSKVGQKSLSNLFSKPSRHMP